MKLFLLLTVLIPTILLATTAPFHPYEKAKNTAQDALITTAGSDIDSLEAVIGSPSTDGKVMKQSIRATFDTQVDGSDVGAYDLGEDLPANAVITNAWLYTVTQFVDGGSGSLAVHCEDANNIYNAADYTGNAAKSIVLGTATYNAPVANIAAAC